MKAPNRFRMLPAVVLFAGLVLTSSFVSKSPAQDPNESESLVQRGFAINPVPLNLDGKNHALVGLGSYIVNARGNCNGCHTCPSNIGQSNADNPFVTGGTLSEVDTPGPVNKDNYLAGGVVFARPNGTFVSKNITPDPTEGNMPEGLTFEQFLTVMQTGHDPDRRAGDASVCRCRHIPDQAMRSAVSTRGRRKIAPPVSISASATTKRVCCRRMRGDR